MLKRLIALLVVAVVAATALGVAPMASRASEAPAGTYLGTWPYKLPPEHHFNAYGGGLDDNLGVIYRQMVTLAPAYFVWAENRYESVLAESFGFTDDNKSYTIKFKAANWSNGKAFSADDVLATYAVGRIMGWAQFNAVSEVQKVDDLTVKFMFKADASLLVERQLLKEMINSAEVYGELAKEATDLVASGKASDSEEWKALRTKITEFRPAELLATGPYTYTLEDVNDQYLTLKWQPNSLFSGMVKFGEIRLWAGETDATTPLVLSGDIAHSTNVYPVATQQAIADAGIRLIVQPRMYGPALLFKHDVYPFNVKEVRQAIAYLINREESAFLTNGFGATATKYMAGLLDSSVPTLMNQADIDKLNLYEQSSEKASELLTAAGFSLNADGKWADKDGKTIKAEYKFPAEFADFSAAAQNAIDQMNAFGFEITARALPWQQTADDIRAGNFELSVWSWGNTSPFASRQFFGPTQRFNYVSFTDGRVGMNFQMKLNYNGTDIDLNEMINAASNGLDPEVQKQRAGEIALIINDLMPFVPLNVILSTEPFNEKLIAGAPADGDPILANPSTDHFVIWYLLNGKLSPAQ
jgi:peptide/nickel transport system substrate-binding protein